MTPAMRQCFSTDLIGTDEKATFVCSALAQAELSVYGNGHLSFLAKSHFQPLGIFPNPSPQ